MITAGIRLFAGTYYFLRVLSIFLKELNLFAIISRKIMIELSIIITIYSFFNV